MLLLLLLKNIYSLILYSQNFLFILFGLVPALTVKFAFKETLEGYGVRIGDWKFGLWATIILFPLILLLLLYPASQTAEMRSFYPFDRSITSFSSENLRAIPMSPLS